MHYALLYPNEYLSAADLKGRDVTLTISRLVQEDLRVEKGTERKWILFFAEVEAKHRRDPKNQINKRLVLNKTNAKSIAKVWGPETTEWVGKPITLYPTTCQAFGEQVDCIRVRQQKPKQKRTAQPEPPPPEPEIDLGHDDDHHEEGLPV